MPVIKGDLTAVGKKYKPVLNKEGEVEAVDIILAITIQVTNPLDGLDEELGSMVGAAVSAEIAPNQPRLPK